MIWPAVRWCRPSALEWKFCRRSRLVESARRVPIASLNWGDGNEISCHALMVATGVQWRRLEAPGIDRLQGAGIYYGGGATEALSCQGEVVYVVGGANSAGQAAMNFARYAERVVILVRGASCHTTSRFDLRDQETPNIQLWAHASVAERMGRRIWRRFRYFARILTSWSGCRRARCSSLSEPCHAPIGWRTSLSETTADSY